MNTVLKRGDRSKSKAKDSLRLGFFGQITHGSQITTFPLTCFESLPEFGSINTATVLRKSPTTTEITYDCTMLTKLGGFSPSIFVMQTTEYRFRKYPSSGGYGLHLAVCRRPLLTLIGNTWS